jgi:ABC-type Mn2+/Zn2+ transport system ATPase subunit
MGTKSDPLLALDRVEAGYGGRAILPPISLSVGPSQIWALLGRNGSGKSTMLATMLGLLPAVRGSVKRRSDLRVSFVPQRGDYDLSVPARVIDYVRGGIDQGWSFLKPGLVYRSRARIDAAMQATEVLAFARRQLALLSEGQKQRVLIARAIVSDPELIVLDEPTSAMDAVAEQEIFELLAKLVRERNMSVLIASHQLSFAPRYATHAILVDGEESTADIGPVEEVTRGPTFRKRYGSVIRDG